MEYLLYSCNFEEEAFLFWTLFLHFKTFHLSFSVLCSSGGLWIALWCKSYLGNALAYQYREDHQDSSYRGGSTCIGGVLGRSPRAGASLGCLEWICPRSRSCTSGWSQGTRRFRRGAWAPWWCTLRFPWTLCTYGLPLCDLWCPIR